MEAFIGLFVVILGLAFYAYLYFLKNRRRKLYEKVIEKYFGQVNESGKDVHIVVNKDSYVRIKQVKSFPSNYRFDFYFMGEKVDESTYSLVLFRDLSDVNIRMFSRPFRSDIEAKLMRVVSESDSSDGEDKLADEEKIKELKTLYKEKYGE